MAGIRILAVFLLTFLFGAYALADMVTLKSGQKVEGKIIERTDQYVKIDFQGVILTYYQEEITGVSQDSRQLGLGADLGFKPGYKPIDFTELAGHYQAVPEVERKEEERIKADLQTPILPGNANLPVGAGDMPVQYQGLAQTSPVNPEDLSAALSNMPKEYRKMVEEVMKNMPQPGAVIEGEKKE